ncbi:DUF1488 domain-containing protein [Erwinia tracheiphila]|uniref:DUF1488 domain-containing protein n=1 Tax=Erwinia tracheiphila TaxID=65700 RepID=A0A0M2KJ33_9GAMM|nr:DUF1488 domain-containing protein [Erwinia tracheiphila]AXF78109.1 DUF1488 domain-containing protein [Erwinia tracheiphila]EOS95512.1 hypothetical protein ETR_07831 [Erwinia tracheiphila PSU-1]KKF37258.1 hypothetical protein SY86_20520 [Erwinia tracheiphila]UIA83177.1 DUF1488 domain-containing protein [Erwinia tracheiphila]UIA88652.1 DUF1488 domain-containing protein [Erwinia tracheiphila]
MNQAIQFPEREIWEEALNTVCFPALVNGFQVTCAISGESLIRRFGEDKTLLVLFCQHRWDLEEEAESLIKSDQEDHQGWFWLS